MVQGKEVRRLINVDPLADRWSVSRHALILLSFAATMTHCAQAQNIEGQPIAAQYGEFEVQNEGNGFAFDPANCNVTGGGENFPAFTTGTPVKVVDALPAQTEVSTTVTAFLSGSNCAVSLGGLAYQHTSFYLTSGTGGLQEALNNEKIRAGGNNTIILNSRWYELIAPRNASAVISTVSGSYSFGLVDITTNPYTSYNWNGSQYVTAGPPGGSPSGAAGGALSGNYPNPGLSSNPIALPAGSTATTCTPGENDTNVATNACVAASASSGGPPSGTAGGSLSGTYPNPAIVNPLNLSTGGTFGSSNYASYLNSFVTGSSGYAGNCALTSTWYKSITSAVNGCVSAPASGTGTTITNGGIFSAYTQDTNQEAVGLISNGYAYANGTTAYSQNPLVTDAAGLTSNVVLVGQENDLQPLNPTSAYLAGVAFRATLAYTGSPSNTGNYPFDAFTINTNVPGAYWRSGLTTYVGAFSNSFGTLFDINANGTATSSSGNYNCPTLLNAYEAYWTGSANAYEGWTMGCNVGSGTNPTTDNFKLSHAAGTAPAGQTHTFELANGIQLQLDGSTSGSASLSASATGGALNITAPTFVPSIGSILQVDGFNSYASCVARGTWSSSTAYNNCDTVTYGGVTWIAVHGSTNVTPIQSSPGGSQFWLQFRSDGANVAATQADYAFFWAYGLVNTNSTSLDSNAAVSLVFGAPAGGYLKNGDWVEPNNTYGYTISLIGQGRGQTIITQNTSTLNYMLVQPPISSASGEEISGIEFNANLLAAGCLDVHIRRATYRDLVCFNPQFQSGQTVIGSNSWNTTSTAGTFLFGQAADAYELHVSDILTRTPAYSGIVAAQGTATVTSGAITAITYTNTGTNLNLPAVTGAGLVAYFFGKGPSSTSFQPCATMPVVSSIALTGGSINTTSGVGGITFTSAGSSCGGTIYVLIKQAGAIPYGYYIGSTDSSYENLVSSGDFSTACELVNHGANVLNHEHPYCQAPYQIYASGGGTNQGSDIHSNTEFDSPIQYGAYIKNGGEIFSSWSTEWNSNTSYAGAGDMLLDTSVHDTYIGPNWCGPWQEGGGYAKFTGTGVGPITPVNAASVLGSNNFISGNQPLCDGSAGQWGTYPAGGGGGVTLSTQYQIPSFGAGGTSVVGTNVTTDSTGNNVNVPGATTSKVVNGIPHSDLYPQATLSGRINACIADAMAGTNGATAFTCDSSNEAYSQTDASGVTIAIGGAASGNRVKWIHPAFCNWSFTGFTGGASDIMDLYGGSSIEGIGATNPTCVLYNNSPTSGARAVFQTLGGGTSGGNYYFRVRGIGFANEGVGVASGATMVINTTNDGSVFEDLLVLNYVSGESPILFTGNTSYGACCTTSFNRIVAAGNHHSGPIVKFNTTNFSGQTAVEFTNSSLTHPAAGQPIISCSNSTIPATAYAVLDFDNTYMEGNNTDTTTPFIVSTNCQSLKISGLSIFSLAGGSTAPAIQLNGTFKTALDLSGLSMFKGFASYPAIAVQNNIAGFNCASTPCNGFTDANGNLAHYTNAFDPNAQAAQTNVVVANVKQYGAIGNGASHQACTVLGLANLAALQAYNGGQFSFATACTNQMDWLATQYAVNLLTSTGGSIKLSGGPYIWDQPVILPNAQDSYSGSLKAIYLLGDGEGGTLVEPAVADFGANSGMVSCGLPTASYSDNGGTGSGRYGGVGACYGGISDITFYNPYSDTYNGGANVNVSSSTYARGITNVPAPGYSGSPIQMDGVLLGGRMNLKRVGAWGFRMGFNLVGDHMTWDQLDAEKDFCGLYWAPASIYLVGDIVMQGHSFISGNTFAGTCVDKDASVIGFYQLGEIYTGYQPYGFIKFPGISDNYGEAYGGAYTPFFANANFDIMQSEAIGNAVMWDDNLTTSGGGVQTGQASIGGVKINGIYTVFGSSSGQKITTGGRGPYAYFGSGSFNGFKLGNIYAGASNFYPTTGQLAGIIANNAAYNDGGIDITGDMNNILNQYTAIEFVGLESSGSTMCQNVALHEPGVWDGAEVAIYPAATEPAVGNLLQVYNYQAGTVANGSQPVIGVTEQALTTNTAGGQCVAYANHGIATVSTASTPALGALLVATTAGQATAATSGVGGYEVGTVHNNITNPPVQLSLGGFTPGTNTLSVYAPLASPALTGTPTAPTAAANTNNTRLATTAYAQNPGPITPTTVTASGVVTAPGLWPQSKASGPYAVWFDDFFSTANNSLNQIPGGNSGTCSANNTYADANHPGNILLNSFTTSGDGVTCGLQSTSGAVVGANTSAGWMWETEVYVPILPGTTAGAYQAGLSGSPNASPWTNGIGFYLSSANASANDWYIRYGSTATDCSIAAVAATWTRLTMVNDGITVHWYVNGTQCGTGVAIGSMPSNTMYGANWSAVTLTASTAVTMAVDYVDFQRAVSR